MRLLLGDAEPQSLVDVGFTGEGNVVSEDGNHCAMKTQRHHRTLISICRAFKEVMYVSGISNMNMYMGWSLDSFTHNTCT